MPRIARIALEGIPYHITQRGNGGQQVFFEDRDYSLYLDLLRRYADVTHLQIWAYCLMPNHVHVIAAPERARSMAAALGRKHADYARYFNLRRRSCGHVWQARLFSCPLDSAHLWRAMAYVERNPVRAGMIRSAEQYRWSSAAAHTGVVSAWRGLATEAWRLQYTADRWREALRCGVDEEAFGERLQEASRRGRPIAMDEFVEELEAETGRRIRPRRPGRPSRNHGTEEGQFNLQTGI